MIDSYLILDKDTGILPVEVKIREKIKKEDVKFLFRFLERNNLQKALLVTLDTETKYQKGNVIVDAIPYWKYWSIMRIIRGKG